ncbi:hypothetical protein FB472_2279 [Rhodoglobus vestalii]|uniref:Uncharacterized protein n=1 Tax=Rhodoglobus vestalii TaxID=193384 RepID=A0A8H2K6B0_9MICO|nr:hypothetical protein FB472_2279 [Rhodoglobus vestalii]
MRVQRATVSRSLLTNMGEALVIRREIGAAAGDGLGVLRGWEMTFMAHFAAYSEPFGGEKSVGLGTPVCRH